MPVSEQISDKIFQLNEDLSKFIQQDKVVGKEFSEYVKSLKKPLERDTLAYFIFDKTLENGKSAIDIYLAKNKNLPEYDKKILKNFKNSINSIFEIKKILKDGFEMYNLVNEKMYTVKSLVKMTSYRGVMQGYSFTCRIVPFENEYYLIVLNSVLGTADKKNAYKLAVSMQVENPALLYKDNKKKLKEIEKIVQTLGIKFVKFFQNSEIITLNTHINELLDNFNNFVENGKTSENIQNFVNSPENYCYFRLQDDTDPFDIAAKRPDTQNYDVGIIYDNDLGIQVLPFYGTFRQIFEIENYNSISGYAECIFDYFNNDKVPPGAIQRVYAGIENKEKFMKIVCEVLEIKEKVSFEEILQKYKKDFMDEKKFSSTTALYASEAFENLMNSSEEEQIKKSLNAAKIGRNDPCLCGSGKKYKKCCANC